MYKKWVIIFIIFNICPVIHAQKVGLVLSGGGAKGVAHIGVIKALEEYRVPIDYIGGTSMGAIIGSLYAIGYGPDEMVEILKSENFRNWLTGTIVKEYRYYFKSEQPTPGLISIAFDLSDTIPKTLLPLNLIPNHLMDFAFMEIYAQASALADNDFDKLFVPFLCIGSDISNNREIVFRKGDLAQAVRASMTFPLYFRPIIFDGNIMYDGGIYNNFPLNRVKEAFNPGYVIGSKTTRGNLPPNEFDVMAQVENMDMNPIETSIEPNEGIIIDMDFPNTSLLDFNRIDEFVDIGYRTAREKIDSIKLQVSRTGHDTTVLKHMRMEFNNHMPELLFNDIMIDGLNNDQQGYIEKSLRRYADTFDLKNLRQEYLKLAHDKNLRYIYPSAEFNREDSLFDLRLRIIPQTTLEAQFGLFFSSTGHSQTFLGVSYRNLSEIATHFKGNIQFGSFYGGGSIGVRFDYPSKIPVFFDGTLNFNRFNYNYASTDFFFEDLKPPYIIQNQVNLRFDTGVPVSVNSMITGGISAGRNDNIYYQGRQFESTDTSDVSSLNQVSSYFAVKSSTLDERQFACSGDFRKIAVRAGYDSEIYKPGSTSLIETNQRKNYFWFSARYEDISYIDLTPHFTLGTSLILQAAFKPLLSNYYSTIIEAPVFNPNIVTTRLFLENYRANQFISVGIMPVLKISKQIHVKLEAYAFVPVQEILKDENNMACFGNYFKTVKPMVNGSVNFITPVGPVSFNTAWLNNEDKKWIVQLSFGYMLFNKKTLDE
ncbi:MAG TPA: hypothetical protein ENN61_06040 [Bacteroidaceae bacterium]|nr:hypothetical protein [Bacteroidaceae bacterium]